MPHDETEEPGAVVTLDNMYQEIKGLRTDVTTMLANLANNTAIAQDHETRIRTLEKRVWIAAGAAAVLASTIPDLSAIASALGA